MACAALLYILFSMLNPTFHHSIFNAETQRRREAEGATEACSHLQFLLFFVAQIFSM